MNPTDQELKPLGVNRMADNEKAYLISFSRPLDDDELRDLHEFLRGWIWQGWDRERHPASDLSAPPGDSKPVADKWLILKRGYYYRPNRCGYTASKAEAGLYTEEEARAEIRVEPDAVSIVRFEDDVQCKPLYAHPPADSIAQFHKLEWMLPGKGVVLTSCVEDDGKRFYAVAWADGEKVVETYGPTLLSALRAAMERIEK